MCSVSSYSSTFVSTSRSSSSGQLVATAPNNQNQVVQNKALADLFFESLGATLNPCVFKEGNMQVAASMLDHLTSAIFSVKPRREIGRLFHYLVKNANLVGMKVLLTAYQRYGVEGEPLRHQIQEQTALIFKGIPSEKFNIIKQIIIDYAVTAPSLASWEINCLTPLSLLVPPFMPAEMTPVQKQVDVSAIVKLLFAYEACSTSLCAYVMQYRDWQSKGVTHPHFIGISQKVKALEKMLFAERVNRKISQETMFARSLKFMHLCQFSTQKKPKKGKEILAFQSVLPTLEEMLPKWFPPTHPYYSTCNPEKFRAKVRSLDKLYHDSISSLSAPATGSKLEWNQNSAVKYVYLNSKVASKSNGRS